MRKKLAIGIVAFGSIVILIGISLSLSNNKKEQQVEKGNFELLNKKYIKNCVDDACGEPNDLYAHLSYSPTIDIIDASLKTMNGNTDYYYEYVTTSTFNGCEDKKLVYSYRKGISNDYYYLENEDYITFSVERIETDFCTNKVTNLPIETYVYEKENKKMLTQSEFQQQLGYTSEELDEIIKKYLSQNNLGLVQDSYYGKALYYKSDGKLFVSFSYNDDFMAILVK